MKKTSFENRFYYLHVRWRFVISNKYISWNAVCGLQQSNIKGTGGAYTKSRNNI